MRDHEHSDSTHRDVKQSARQGRVRLSLSRGTIATCLAAAGFAVAAVAGSGSRAFAADGSWNVNAIGNWSTADRWLGNVIPGSTSSTSSTDIATFGFTISTGRTVTVDANRNIGGIVFSNTSNFAYTLATGPLLLSSGGVIQSATNNGAHTDTISSAITIQGVGGSGTFTAGATNASSLLRFQTGGITGVSTAGSTTTLTLNGGNTGANLISGVIGDGSAGGRLAVVKDGSGVWRLSGANTFSGGVALNSGTLELGNDAALGTGKLTIAGGAIDVTGARVTTNNNAQDWNGDFTFVGTNTLNLGSGAVAMNASRTVTVNASTLTVGGVISGAGFGITKTGAGELRISGTANTYTGVTTINQGILAISGSAFGNGGAASPLGASSNAAGNLILDGGTLRTVNAATVISTDRLFTMGTGGATLDSQGGNTAQFNFTNTGNIAFQGSGSRTLTLTSGATNRPGSFNPSLGDGPAGATSLVKSGANTWTVNGNLTFTGGVSITEGTLSLTGTQNNFSGGVNVGAAGSLSLDTTGTMSFTQDLVNNGLITTTKQGGEITLAGVISGTGSINSVQVPNFIISNTNNSYTGITKTQANASAATITVSKLADGGQNSSIGASSSAASNLVLQNNNNGFTSLTYTGSGDSTDRLFTITTGTANVGLASSGIVNNGTGTLNFTNTGAIAYGRADSVARLELAGSNTGDNTFAPTIGDNGTAAVSFTKSGAGRWALTGNNTYTGTTTVSAGTLLVNGTNSGSGTVTVASTATLGGSGRIAGLVTVSGFLSPGNSPGLLTTGSLALQASSTTLIEIAGSTRGTTFDGLDILSSGGLTYGGSLVFDISALFPATSTLDVFNFTGAAAGSYSSVTATGSYGALTFTNDGSGLWSSGTTAVADTTITFNQSTGDVTFVIVPEPGAIALAGIGIAAAASAYRRRRR